MSTIITAAGESLLARLQAEGKPLVIDSFIFANLPGQDHTEPLNPNTAVPEEQVVLRYSIPENYRCFINRNQVVYSALLGSDIGDFSFNWQGLYCSEHTTLVAVSSFPALEKRAVNELNGQVGNNITRNFMLEFSGAKEATGIKVAAEVWQLDFSLRLRGIDERERLSNRVLYGRASFMTDAWKLERSGEGYSFRSGLAFIEGLRVELAEDLPLPTPALPCSVWLDVCQEQSGSDVAVRVNPVLAGPDEVLQDYVSPAPLHVRHYLQRIAMFDAEGKVTDRRGKVGEIGDVLTVGSSGSIEWGASEVGEAKFAELFSLTAELNGKLATLERYALCEFYYFRRPNLKPGFQPAQGGLIADAATLYPEAWAYLQTAEGLSLCKSEAEWQAMTQAIWHTNADGTEVGWNGIGGAPFYAPDLNTGALRLPDLRGMYAEAAGFDALDVGGCHGDAVRNIWGEISSFWAPTPTGAFYAIKRGSPSIRGSVLGEWSEGPCGIDTAHIVPTSAKNQPRAWGALACVYLGTPR